MNEGIVIVEVGSVRIGLPVEQIVTVERMVTLTPVGEDAELYVDGVIDVRGELAPVVCLGAHLGLDVGPPDISDRLAISRPAEKLVALRVTRAIEVVAPPAPDEIFAVDDADRPDHLLRTTDGLVLFPDLARAFGDLDLPDIVPVGTGSS